MCHLHIGSLIVYEDILHVFKKKWPQVVSKNTFINYCYIVGMLEAVCFMVLSQKLPRSVCFMLNSEDK